MQAKKDMKNNKEVENYTERPKKNLLGKYLFNEKGKKFIAEGGMIALYGRYYRAMLDGGWGCDGCAIAKICDVKSKMAFGACEGDKRPDGKSIIFADCGTNPFR